MNPNWIRDNLAELSSRGKYAHQLLWWEFQMRISLHPLFKSIAEDILALALPDYPVSNFDDDEWILAATDEERKAYLRGARMHAFSLLEQWEKAFGLKFDHTVTLIDRRSAIEERIGRYLAGTDELPHDS